jgi:nucleoside-diphosphate-sugar epimerase
MQVCVTGGNGFIGRYLVAALYHQGHSIRVLTRKQEYIFPADIQVVIGDLTKHDCPLDEFIYGCEVLFHCAGEVQDVDVMRLLHVNGTKQLIQSVLNEHSLTGQAVHWVQLSSVGAYGPPLGKPETERLVTEDTITQPANEYEITKTISDELVIHASKSKALTYSILRPANVFGTKMTNQSLRRLIEMVKHRLFIYVGKPGAITTFVHVDDVVKALLICGTDARAKNQIYNLSDNYELEYLVKNIAHQLGVREPRLRIPTSLIRHPLDLFTKLVKPLIHIPSLNVLLLRTSYSTQKIETQLEFSFSKPFSSRIEELVKEFS